MLKTSEQIGDALDLAVAKWCGYDEGWLLRQLTNPDLKTRAIPKFSTDWAEGGPIIEREGICLWSEGYDWEAKIQTGPGEWLTEWDASPLVAAMRCYVSSKHITRKNIC